MKPRPVRRGRLRVVRGTPSEGSTSTPRAAVASLVLPGLGQLLQGRRRAAAGHLCVAVVSYVGVSRLAWPTSFQVGALLAVTLWSAADALRAERLARRAPLRLV